MESSASKPRFASRSWNCLCECGTHVKLKSSDLTSAKGYRSCGCYWDDTLVGTKVNSLSIIGKKGSNYNCICDCGRSCVVKCAYVKNGTRKDCKCSNMDSPSPGRKHIDAETSIYTGLTNQCRSAARQRGIEYSLSHSEYKSIVSMECLYCGHPGDKRYSKRKGNSDLFIVANGVDRINNKIGYILENCVACCFTCNIIKNNQNVGSFIEQCKRISDRCYDLLDFMP